MKDPIVNYNYSKADGIVNMYPSSSLDEFVRFYYRDGEEFVGQGVWSILVADTPDLGAEFASRYFDIFNEIAGRAWHLVVCAEYKHGKWLPSKRQHSACDTIREIFEESRNPLPKLSIVFFSPFKGVVGESAFVPLNYSALGDFDFYRDGFKVAHKCILEVCDELDVNIYI